MMIAAELPPPRELDEVTLRLAQRGDPSAFRRLVEQYHRAVWELASRMLYGTAISHRAEDVVQETFVRIHRALPRFDADGAARLSTWIHTIATRVALNELREVPRANARVALDQITDLPADGDPLRSLAARRRSAAIGAAMAELPEHSRAVLILREYFDLDYDEIADALEIDIGTVKSRLSRARTNLRERLVALGRGDEHV